MINKYLLYLVFFIEQFYASEIGPQLKAYRALHNTYFITRTNREKYKGAHSLNGSKISSIHYSSCQEHQDNATLDFTQWEECEQDVVHQIKLDGKTYLHEEALGYDRTIILSVTIEYFKNFLSQNNLNFYNNKVNNLILLLNEAEKTIEGLSRKNQDQVIETFLYCCGIHAGPCEPSDKYIVVFKKEFANIVFSNNSNIEQLKDIFFHNSKSIILVTVMLLLTVFFTLQH